MLGRISLVLISFEVSASADLVDIEHSNNIAWSIIRLACSVRSKNPTKPLSKSLTARFVKAAEVVQIRHQTLHSSFDLSLKQFHVVVIICCQRACPVFEGVVSKFAEFFNDVVNKCSLIGASDKKALNKKSPHHNGC